jgi:hypothetical protein
MYDEFYQVGVPALLSGARFNASIRRCLAGEGIYDSEPIVELGVAHKAAIFRPIPSRQTVRRSGELGDRQFRGGDLPGGGAGGQPGGVERRYAIANKGRTRGAARCQAGAQPFACDVTA